MKLTIAIDGPAGAGKSTVAKIVAEKLDLIYIDTGAMYRALTWKALKSSVSFEEETLSELAAKTKIYFVQFPSTNKQRVFCDDEDVTDEIRRPQVSKYVSRLAGYRRVREQLLKIQRQLALNGGVVMDGRDIGTFVLPDAHCKFFLTASLDARSKRRFLELASKGISIKFNDLKQEIEQRDIMDLKRDFAPLAVAPDAEIVDTTELSIEQVVDMIITKCRGRS